MHDLIKFNILTPLHCYFTSWKINNYSYIISMYTGFKPNTSISKTITSGLGETQLETLQREVDNYTRRLEQEKKKYFSVQDSYKIVSEEYQKEKVKLDQFKKESTKAHNIIAQSKVKNLESDL